MAVHPFYSCRTQLECARTLLFRGAKKSIANKANHTAQQDALLAGNNDLAELIQNYEQRRAGKQGSMM